MDILRHGKHHKNEYTMHCGYCGCIFAYAETDRHGFDLLHDKEYVTCPECNKWLCHEYRIKGEINELYNSFRIQY